MRVRKQIDRVEHLFGEESDPQKVRQVRLNKVSIFGMTFRAGIAGNQKLTRKGLANFRLGICLKFAKSF